eukprot:CAMPEP_0204316744 /NCGR_PEP_ID=MMETSP0469-20131031/5566_1 /ASSEMBLY_ACC=CAM_ASM_000384 /TAXON_ID=2969 /ORGANISM="Oxyrrhis marina" /LENGTH=165 /DNA_ID=CAMNT_0051297553 /DNA_START=34 /DNA_END=531 /DNA_ORIENTATION=+
MTTPQGVLQMSHRLVAEAERELAKNDAVMQELASIAQRKDDAIKQLESFVTEKMQQLGRVGDLIGKQKLTMRKQDELLAKLLERIHASEFQPSEDGPAAGDDDQTQEDDDDDDDEDGMAVLAENMRLRKRLEELEAQKAAAQSQLEQVQNLEAGLAAALSAQMRS